MYEEELYDATIAETLPIQQNNGRYNIDVGSIRL